MKTDIVIKNKSSNKQLVIDTKFYSETLVPWRNSEIKKLHSNHLYQLNTYLDNINDEVKNGLLLYPTIDTDIEETIHLQDKSIKIKTIDLNTDWDIIKCDLLALIDF